MSSAGVMGRSWEAGITSSAGGMGRWLHEEWRIVMGYAECIFLPVNVKHRDVTYTVKY